MIKLLYAFVASILLCSSISVVAENKLVFPASKIEKQTRNYLLDSSIKTNDAALKLVKPEYLADTLLSLLAEPSKSCQETATTNKAREILLQVASPLAIKVSIDDLPKQLAQMSSEKRKALSCNSGKTAPESGNLIAFIPGNIAAPSWNLSFHLDTNQLSFEGIKLDGDTISPAANTPLGADDKAGIAIVAEVLRIIAENKIEHGDIRIVGLVAEEDSAVGAELIEAEAFKGDILVSIDGTDPDEIGRAAPAMYNGYITVSSQTSHPAEVDSKQSVSACAVGSQILHEAGFRADAHPPGHPNVVLHSYFISCGINKRKLTAKGEPVADYQYNTISPFWSAAWQMRNLEGNEAAQKMVLDLEKTVHRICAEAGRNRTKLKCDITGVNEAKLSGYIVAEESASIQLLKTGFERTGDDVVRITAKQFGGFNGNLIKARFDEEMVIVGTGADQIHTNEETISVAGMTRVARGLLASMLESYRYRVVD